MGCLKEKHQPLAIIEGGANPRAKAVAKFRDLADRLEAGELRGARVSWREGRAWLEYVEVDSFDTAKPEVRWRREDLETGEVEVDQVTEQET